MKQSVQLCSTIPINLTGGSLQHSSTILRWASPPNGDLLSAPDDNSVTLSLRVSHYGDVQVDRSV